MAGGWGVARRLDDLSSGWRVCGCLWMRVRWAGWQCREGQRSLPRGKLGRRGTHPHELLPHWNLYRAPRANLLRPALLSLPGARPARSCWRHRPHLLPRTPSSFGAWRTRPGGCPAGPRWPAGTRPRRRRGQRRRTQGRQGRVGGLLHRAGHEGLQLRVGGHRLNAREGF